MDNVLQIQNSNRKSNFLKMNYHGLDLLNIIHHVLSVFYYTPFDTETYQKPPVDWNPILLVEGRFLFDPFMMTGTDSRAQTGNSDSTWKPWPQINGLGRTRLFIDQHFDYFMNPKRFTEIDTQDPFLMRRHYLENHIMFTFETLSKNELVINILYLPTKKYKRILIKDTYEFAPLSIAFDNDYPRLGKIKQSKIISQKLKDKKMYDLIEDGSNIPIQNENVREILYKFGFLETTVYEFKIS